MSPERFVVWVHKEPKSGTKGKQRYARKSELIEEIKRLKEESVLEAARRGFAGKPVKVSVRFNLQKPLEGHSDTSGKKDLDNMLKLVLDSLQRKADTQGKLDGLGIIDNDNAVYRIEAVKRIVDRPDQVGLKITVSEFK